MRLKVPTLAISHLKNLPYANVILVSDRRTLVGRISELVERLLQLPVEGGRVSDVDPYWLYTVPHVGHRVARFAVPSRENFYFFDLEIGYSWKSRYYREYYRENDRETQQ